MTDDTFGKKPFQSGGIIPLIEGSKGLGSPSKVHIAKGHFGGADIFWHEDRCITSVFTAEIDDPDNTSIPLWLTPTHKQMIELYQIGGYATDRVRCNIVDININNQEDCLTKVDYHVKIEEPYCTAFDRLYRSQENQGRILANMAYMTLAMMKVD